VALSASVVSASYTPDEKAVEATIRSWETDFIFKARDCLVLSGPNNLTAPCWVEIFDRCPDILATDGSWQFDFAQAQCVENTETWKELIGAFFGLFLPVSPGTQVHDVRHVRMTGKGDEYAWVKQVAYIEQTPTTGGVMQRTFEFNCLYGLVRDLSSPTGFKIRDIHAMNDHFYGGSPADPSFGTEVFAENSKDPRDWTDVRHGCSAALDYTAPTGVVAANMALAREKLRQGLSGAGYGLAHDVLSTSTSLFTPGEPWRLGKTGFTELWDVHIAARVGGVAEFAKYHVHSSEFHGNMIRNYVNYRVCDKSDLGNPARSCIDLNGVEVWIKCKGEFVLDSLALIDTMPLPLPTPSP
jgi:hypothetical protein